MSWWRKMFGKSASRPGPPHGAAGERLYTNPIYGWSISYPAEWTIDGEDPGFVRVYPPQKKGLCGIHSEPIRFTTVDNYTDFALDHTTQVLRDRGLTLVLLARQPISLPNEVVGNDVLTEILPGGKSRRIHVLSAGRGFTIDCETYTQNWGNLEAAFDRIIGSFTLVKRP